ncbi:MAG: L-serine ammonia-lyase, partial [Pseudomonadota bacterium]
MLSVLEIFKIGVGPSSSHTVGPMRAARRFLEQANKTALSKATRVNVELQGSLALTGVGHASDRAVVQGLMGYEPETIDPERATKAFDAVRSDGRIFLFGKDEPIPFDFKTDLELRGHVIPRLHPNGMKFRLLSASGEILAEDTYYSVGGGFIASVRQLSVPAKNDVISTSKSVAFPFASAAELMAICVREKSSIADVVLQNEDAYRSREKTIAGLDAIWDAMSLCIERGLSTDGTLPGGLSVKRRAPGLHQSLRDTPFSNDPERIFDWLNVYAMAVNEENAAGGRVVTAPTNGAAGIIPSVLRYYCCDGDRPELEQIRKFLVTAGGVGMLYKMRASISGAEMGCQGEVGVACSMAAAGLAAVWGATPQQIEQAAEIAMEHNLGLTCDPVGGLVQIPCIERNAIGAVKAANAARLA